MFITRTTSTYIVGSIGPLAEILALADEFVRKPVSDDGEPVDVRAGLFGGLVPSQDGRVVRVEVAGLPVVPVGGHLPQVIVGMVCLVALGMNQVTELFPVGGVDEDAGSAEVGTQSHVRIQSTVAADIVHHVLLGQEGTLEGFFAVLLQY